MSATPFQKQLPMYATSVRFVAAPVFFVVLLAENDWADILCATLFIFASFTDWLDGYWARKFDALSTIGKFMDPIADKVLTLSALVVLLYLDRVDPVMVTFLISRDIFIGGIRSAAAADGLIIDAKSTGKVKTALQMLCIPCLFLEDIFPSLYLHEIGYYGLWFSVVLSFKSGWEYTRAYFNRRKEA